MKQWCIHLATFLVVVAIAGCLVLVAGVVPIKASSGHWPVTRWLLSFAKSRSVATHSQGIDVPDNLDDPAMVIRGAGHFQTACVGCHGSPDQEPFLVTQKMTPTPPDLSRRAAERTPAELFYVTKHGIKFTGMPAFASQQRDDEVWAVTSFLRKLPELNSTSYRDLAFVGDDATPDDAPQVVTQCARCHGYDGRGRGRSAFPKLDGLHRAYFVATLRAYADGTRHSGTMEPIASRLDDSNIETLAEYFANRANSSESASSVAAEPAESAENAIGRGESIAMNGLPAQDIGACVSCHPRSRASQNPSYPYLVGQPASYLVTQLKLLQEHKRGGTEFVELMKPHVKQMKGQQMQDVAQFYESIGR